MPTPENPNKQPESNEISCTTPEPQQIIPQVNELYLTVSSGSDVIITEGGINESDNNEHVVYGTIGIYEKKITKPRTDNNGIKSGSELGTIISIRTYKDPNNPNLTIVYNYDENH